MSLTLDLIFPKNCLICGQGHKYFCPSCLAQQTRNPIQHLSNNSQCEGCLSIFKYNSLIKKAIAEIKYNFVTDICDEIVAISTREIKSNFPHLLKYWQKNNFVLIPIPLYPSRQNWRGFNQSVLLGQQLAKKLKLKFSDQIIIRTKNTHPQAKIINRSDKKSNLKDAFAFYGDIPQNIILFDDVSTTHSTLNSALNTLSRVAQIHCWYLSLAG